MKNARLNSSSKSPLRRAFESKSPLSSDEEYNATATFRDAGTTASQKYPDNYATAGANRPIYSGSIGGNNPPLMHPN